MEQFLVPVFIAILKTTISGISGKWIAAGKEVKEFNTFLNNTKTWCEDYISKNECSAVANADFLDYIKNYHFIDNIVNFIQYPNEKTEYEFINECYENAKMYLKSKRCINRSDYTSIKRFIEEILNRTKAFYEGKLPTYDTALLYYSKQNNNKLDALGNDLQEIKKLLQPKTISFKKVYSMPENTIVRKWALFKDLQESFYLSLQTENMLDVCLREKCVVLLGEAGSGKSIALQQLVAMAGDTEYYPIFYSLSNYTNSSIEQLVQGFYPNLDEKKLFLIFDAYDEIEEKNQKGFARNLSDFVSTHADTIVVVSSRNNFYKFSDNEGNGSSFLMFKEYGIVPISKTDLDQHISKNDIEPEPFWREIYKNQLYDLANTPFYFSELLKIYKRNDCLPEKYKLMQEIISNRFQKDCNKYSRTEDVEDNELEIFVCLEQLAFAIQCMKAIKISNIQFQTLFTDSRKRRLIKYSGVFSKDSRNDWKFEHNNFREYLAAKYINNFDIQEIQKIICDKNGKILNSWVNVVSFLIMIRDKEDLLDLLMEKDDEMIVRFENNRVDESTRTDIVIKILDGFATKSVWLSRGFNSADILAKFGQSEMLCDYLMEQISSPINFRAQYNALSVLSEFTELHEREGEITRVLFDALLSSSVREYEKAKILETICSLNLQNEEITLYVTSLFDEKIKTDYRLGILKYLHRSELYEHYIDLFINEYNTPGRHFDDNYRLRRESLDVFVKAKSNEAIGKLISAISKHRHPYSYEKDAYSVVFSNAIESYNSGNKALFDLVFSEIVNTEHYLDEFTRDCFTFFEKTNTKITAFMKLAELDPQIENYQYIYLMEELADDSCYELLLNKYLNHPNIYEKLVVTLMIRLDETDDMYHKYKETLLQNGVAVPERKPFFDRSKAMKDGRQYYFDILFEKEKYCELVEKMVTQVGNKAITFSELKELDYHPVNYHDHTNSTEEYALLQLYHSIEGKDDSIVLDTICGISNWTFFVMSEALHLLKCEKDLACSEEQRSFIKQYCDEQLQMIDFKGDIHENEKGTLSYTYRIQHFIFFSEHFGFEYEKDLYLNLLYIPPLFFETKDNTDYFDIPAFISNNLSKGEIKSRIKDNLSLNGLCNDTVDMYIHFCHKHKLDYAISIAESICLDKSVSSGRKYRSLQYLHDNKGYKFVYDKFLDIDDKELMDNIINLTINYKDTRLKERMELISQKSEGDVYLGYLISLNSKYALERYYEISRDSMKSTTSIEDECIDSVIESIGAITDISLLEIVGKLRALLFDPHFKDKKDFNLQNSLYKAYENLAKTDIDSVKKQLQEALQNPEISDSEKCFCNTLIIDIDSNYSQLSDYKWTVQEIKAFLVSHPTI